jgi:hypothetical protein
MIAGNTHEYLERERKKLLRLIDEALKSGFPITQNDAILEQSRKVDILLAQVQRIYVDIENTNSENSNK